MGLWQGLSGRILYDTAKIGRKQIQDNINAEIGIYIDFSVNICYNWSIK